MRPLDSDTRCCRQSGGGSGPAFLWDIASARERAPETMCHDASFLAPSARRSCRTQRQRRPSSRLPKSPAARVWPSAACSAHPFLPLAGGVSYALPTAFGPWILVTAAVLRVAADLSRLLGVRSEKAREIFENLRAFARRELQAISRHFFDRAVPALPRLPGGIEHHVQIVA